MTYQLTLSIAEDSPQGQNIENRAESERISREEAALRLLADVKPTLRATPASRRILGAFSAPEDAALMDEVTAIIHQDRERQKAERPNDL